ncbi:MAG: efflux RND transporter periplasmic adaptor subunit [Chitinispirillaceae bacterium]|nr:efflux RND transporter periplasmic adaptor subunit [Chitinispirillaceae bacterium]
MRFELLRSGMAAFSLPLMAVIIITGCSVKTPPRAQPKKIPLVTTKMAVIGTISHSMELTGSVEPYRTARLGSPAEGPVVYLGVREGDTVRTGKKLCSIGRKSKVNALVVSLEEELRKEEDNLRRTRELVDKKALAGEQLDAAKAKYENVRAQLAGARETSGDFSITAPWSGVISRIPVREGDFVAPRTTLLELYDPSSLVVRVEIPERESTRLRTGMEARLRFDADPGKTVNGNVIRLYPYLNERTRTRTIEIKPKGALALLPGMFVRVEVITSSVDSAIIVPENAVVINPAGGSIAFVTEGNIARVRKVKTGIESTGKVQIISGIAAGDRVIVAGNEKLKDGAAVRLADPKNEKQGTKNSPPEGSGKETR